MGTTFFIFIIIVVLINILMFYWTLIKRLRSLHKDIRTFDVQLKSIMHSLEKKIRSQELDVGEVKNYFKQLSTKILDPEVNLNRKTMPKQKTIKFDLEKI